MATRGRAPPAAQLGAFPGRLQAPFALAAASTTGLSNLVEIEHKLFSPRHQRFSSLATAAAAAAAAAASESPLPPFSIIGDSGGTSESPSPPSRSSAVPPPPTSTTRLLLLPTKHSRKRLPHVVTDVQELSDLAASLVETEIGQLFTYSIMNEQQSLSSSSRLSSRHLPTAAPAVAAPPLNDVPSSRDTAWMRADATVQKAEAVIRGCAYYVPGTMWNRWSNQTNSTTEEMVSSETLMQIQQQVLDRIYEEGHAYMTLRSIQLEERFGGPVPLLSAAATARAATTSMSEDDDDRTQPLIGMNDSGMNYNDDMENSGINDDDGGDNSHETYLHDFALPGPTIGMYDTMLDTLACRAEAAAATTTVPVNDRQEWLDTANHWHTMAMMRHMLDGGDGSSSEEDNAKIPTVNVNAHTRPTAVTFNALMRLAAALPYEVPTPNMVEDDATIQFRDDAVTTALSTLQAMDECAVVHRNSASYVYTLHSVLKYLPPSNIRDNVARGLFHQARYHGLVNDAVYQAYERVRATSTDNEEPAIEVLLPKWKRNSRKYQFHPREDVY
jgi:hypothetical protein